MIDNLMSTVHPSMVRPEAFDPFGSDPAPTPHRAERALFVIAFAAILGVGAGALASLLGPGHSLGGLGDRPTTSAVATPTASTTVAGVRSGVVAVAGTAGSAGQGGGGGGGGGGPADPPQPPPAAVVASVQITPPSGGAGHQAGMPLYLKVVATNPTTGAAVPGYRLHWTVTRSGGHLVRTATGTTSIVHGALITPGTYRVHVEIQAKGLVGSDDVTLIVPLDLKPQPSPAPPSPKPSPQVSGPSEITVPLPDPHE